jgi:oxygen-independent coproporphyrinogen-3 oxidase
VIERIMCDNRVDLDQVCEPFGADPDRLLGEAAMLEQLVADGIARRDDRVIALTDEARPLVRVLAAAFDQYLAQAPARHSRAV